MGSSMFLPSHCLFFLSGLIFSAQALAATPMLAADSHGTPAIHSGVGLVGALSQLKRQAEKNGTIRVVVGLRMAFSPEGELSADVAAQQREQIAVLQHGVLKKIPSLQRNPQIIKLFEVTPYMGLEVNAAELDALTKLSEIVSIEEDRLMAPALELKLFR